MCTRVLVLIALQVGLSHCFSWDIVVASDKKLEFFYNGASTHIEHLPLAKDMAIIGVTYDPVHYRVLFALAHNQGSESLNSFDLSTRTIQPLLTFKHGIILSVAYDPVTQLLFWSRITNLPDPYASSINSLSLDAASSNKTVNGNPLIMATYNIENIVVDSCGGYFYWITDDMVERARFDGSERKVIIDQVDNMFRTSLSIDQQAEKIYWLETYRNMAHWYIKSASLKGYMRTTIHEIVEDDDNNLGLLRSLTVTKDFIYWEHSEGIFQLPKHPPQGVKEKLISISQTGLFYRPIAVNYSIQEVTQRMKSCDALKSLSPDSSAVPNSRGESLLCVHGTKYSGESGCKCTQGYTGDRCDIRNCEKYCFQGKCSISAKGRPKCRCKPGYTGKRCRIHRQASLCAFTGKC